MSKKKRTNKVRGAEKTPNLESKIESLLNHQPLKSFTVKSIVKKLGFRNKLINNQIPQAVSKLVKNNRISVTPNGSYKSNKKPDVITGKVDHVSSRFAYILTDTEDIYIKDKDLNYALHDDLVEVAVFPSKHGRKPEGKVLNIIERARQTLVGRLEMSKNYGFVVPDNRKIHEDIFIPENLINDANHGDKVIIDIVEFPSSNKSPVGKVVRILGQAGENDAEIHSIMAEFGLPFEFPEQVLKDADLINDDISNEAKHRRDLRDILTFTIDPDDAKDFDDALSMKVLDNGHYEIGVHIADVTHYVKEGTALEEEAINRATSVYLVDRTIPMLPERLSNELCSLRPNEDKLTFSAIFEIDEEAKVHNEWFGRTIIHSDRRFSYEDAQEGIENGTGDYYSELITLNELAKKIKEKRFANGAVNFETTEVKFRLDENGKPIEVIPRMRKDAHKLIEEFMLLANKAVATYVYKRSKGKNKDTFVYRTHDKPNPEKITDFALFASRFGHKVNLEQGGLSSSLNKLLKNIVGKPEENVLQTLAVRSMAKAIYTTEPKGHFGLAFDHYTHFTSPIRRYPDMMVHRLLQRYLNEGKSADKDEYEEKCEHSSEREKRASDAERASIKYKQVEFMSMQADSVYDGIISGVTEWGIYVEMTETHCEGMIRLADLKDDFYEFDEKNYCVVGKSTGNKYQLGDDIKVKVKKTDIDKRIIDLDMVW